MRNLETGSNLTQQQGKNSLNFVRSRLDRYEKSTISYLSQLLNNDAKQKVKYSQTLSERIYWSMEAGLVINCSYACSSHLLCEISLTNKTIIIIKTYHIDQMTTPQVLGMDGKGGGGYN